MNKIKGKQINTVIDFSYGSLRIIHNDGTEYRMSRDELNKILQMHNYSADMSRHFEYLSVNTKIAKHFKHLSVIS
jgi:uncharacterized protein (UPF0216 family)